MINYFFKVKKHLVDNTKDINKQIVLISDIHFSYSFKKRKINKIINKIKSINPDYICITGDIVDHVDIIKDINMKKIFLDFIKELSNITTVLISKGNHDEMKLIKSKFRCDFEFVDNNKWFEELNSINNVYYLDNKFYEDNNIRFIGISLSHEYYHNENTENIINELKNMNEYDNNKYNILMCHSPLNILNDKTYPYLKNINLIFSGHTHNGVMPPILDEIIKGNTGIFNPDNKWFKNARFARGRYDYKNISLIINGGITKIHECSPKYMRVLNELFPMSIDIINVKSK